MRSKRSYLRWCTANLLALSLCAGLELHAQIQGGRGGGGGGGGFGGAGGGPVEPGVYMVKLTVGDKSYTSSVNVLEDIWMRPQ